MDSVTEHLSLQAVFTPNNYAISKCPMPRESTVILLYLLGGTLIFFWVYLTYRRLCRRSRWFKIGQKIPKVVICNNFHLLWCLCHSYMNVREQCIDVSCKVQNCHESKVSLQISDSGKRESKDCCQSQNMFVLCCGPDQVIYCVREIELVIILCSEAWLEHNVRQESSRCSVQYVCYMRKFVEHFEIWNCHNLSSSFQLLCNCCMLSASSHLAYEQNLTSMVKF